MEAPSIQRVAVDALNTAIVNSCRRKRQFEVQVGDYEDYTLARNEEEAAKYFADHLNHLHLMADSGEVWFWEDLLPMVKETQ